MHETQMRFFHIKNFVKSKKKKSGRKKQKMSKYNIYLSGGPNRRNFRRPLTGAKFKNKAEVEKFIHEVDPSITFTTHVNVSTDFVMFPDGESPSASSLRYKTPSLSLSAPLSKVAKQKKRKIEKYKVEDVLRELDRLSITMQQHQQETQQCFHNLRTFLLADAI